MIMIFPEPKLVTCFFVTRTVNLVLKLLMCDLET